MGVENIVGESDGLTFSTECEERADRLARRKDSLPQAVSGFIRNTTIEFRTISLPEAEPAPRMGGLSRVNFYHSLGQKRVGRHVGIYPKSASSASAAAQRLTLKAASAGWVQIEDAKREASRGHADPYCCASRHGLRLTKGSPLRAQFRKVYSWHSHEPT